jgi:predicted O-methyltransferase YrrM
MRLFCIALYIVAMKFASPDTLTSRDRAALQQSRNNSYSIPALQPSATIRKIYKSGTIKVNGKTQKLTSAVSPLEGFHLYSIIKDNPRIECALEIGMANGLSALYMLQGFKDSGKDSGKVSRVTSIDPFQSTQWKCVGMEHVKEAKLKSLHRLIEEKSFEALPCLLAKKYKYDLIFIDGMHLFDYTLIDVFYAIELCREGGVIVIDDIRHAGVAKVVKYMLSNYKFLRLVPDTLCSATAATFIKTGKDTRNWNFHKNF